MKFRLYLTSLILFIVCMFNIPSAGAETVGSVVTPTPAPPTLVASSVIITSAAISSSGPIFVQIYNNSDMVQDLHGWTLNYIAQNTTDELEVGLVNINSWIQPRGYMVFSANGSVNNSDGMFSVGSDLSAQLSVMTTKYFQLKPPLDSGVSPAVFNIAVSWPQWLERNKTTKYLETFSTKYGSAQLYGGGAYLPPEDTAGLQIVEILANAKDCSPLETTLDCGDYVKLFNNGAYPVELANYRLRTDSGGSKSSTTNTVKLSGQLLPGQYTTIHLKDSGDVLSITNDGGYVWLEDMYGVQVYQPVIGYPDFTYKQGQSWAFESSSLIWNYMFPAPDAPNYWPPIEVTPAVVVTDTTVTNNSVLADCGEGRERNPETNRCRSIISASSTTSNLEPCGVGQERNPDTNRCRSILGASTILAACAEGQERNPETNRCRSILAASTNVPAPCPAGQERNPDTNRCRKITTNANDGLTTIADIKSAETASSTNWLIAAGAVFVAIFYAIYEWRLEIIQWFKRFILKA